MTWVVDPTTKVRMCLGIAAAVILLGAFGAQWGRIVYLKGEVRAAEGAASAAEGLVAREREGRTQDRLQWAQAAASAAQANLERAAAREREKQEVLDDEKRKSAALAAGAAGLRSERDQLRDTARAFAAAAGQCAGTTGDPAAAAGSDTTPGAAGVLADVLGACTGLVEVYAVTADQRGLAGAVSSGERATLTTPPLTGASAPEP